MTVQIVKKAAVSRRRQTAYRVFAVLAALAATGLVMALAGYNPFVVYYKMIEGSTMTAYRFQETIHKAIPLITLSLGVAVASLSPSTAISYPSLERLNRIHTSTTAARVMIHPAWTPNTLGRTAASANLGILGKPEALGSFQGPY